MKGDDKTRVRRRKLNSDESDYTRNYFDAYTVWFDMVCRQG